MARIYVGNLPMDIRTRDVEDLFYKYGRIRDIDLKTPNRPPAFAFVCFDDYYDAEAAVRGRDGVMLEGARLRVEMSRGGRGAGPDRYDDRRGGGYYDDPPPRAPPRNLRDLKDHFRPCGDVIYTDVDRYGGGIVEFTSRDEQEEALRRLDDTEYKSKFDSSVTYIRVKKPKDQMTDEELDKEKEKDQEIEDRRASRDARSRSRSGHRKRSASRSRSRSRSRSKRDEDKKDEDAKEDAREDKEASDK